MVEHTFTPGDYKTAGGRIARVLCDDAPGKYPLYGYIVNAGGLPEPAAWCPSGAYTILSGPHGNDLMPPAPAAPEVVVRWVNLYQHPDGCFTATLSRSRNPLVASLVSSTRVILTPGQYDTEDTPSEWDQAIDAAIEAMNPAWHVGPVVTDAIRALKRGNGK